MVGEQTNGRFAVVGWAGRRRRVFGWADIACQALQLRRRGKPPEKQVKADWTGFRAGTAFNAVRQAVHHTIVASLNEIQAASRKERKRAALAQTRDNLRDLPVVAQNAVAAFVENVQERCPTLSERDLFRTAEIFAKMERARSGFDLLKQIQECSPDDIDTWNSIMREWTASNAQLVLSELGQRLRLIERLQQLVDSVQADGTPRPSAII